MAAADELLHPYLVILNISTSEHLKLYNKAFLGLPESVRYDLTRSKWNDFYQELKNYASIFGFKVACFIVTARNGLHTPTEVKYIILS